MSQKRLLALVVAVLALAGLGYSAWRFVSQRESHTCRACSRPVHEHLRTVALIDGKRGVYCCPACALSEHHQESKPAEVIELTDYLGSGPIRSKDAFIVRNSDVNPCLPHAPVLSPDGRPMQAAFDRCLPGMLAFRDEKAAESFVDVHGGRILRFADLASEFSR